MIKDDTQLYGRDLYDVCVNVIQNKILSRTMWTVGDIYYLRYYCKLINKNDDINNNIKENRFIFYIILHYVWTPSRMKYFYNNYIRFSRENTESNFRDILIKSLIGLDDKKRLTKLDDYECASFRTPNVRLNTKEETCIKVVEDWNNLCLTAKNLEKQWNKQYNFTKLTNIAKDLIWHGNYTAAHLIRSLTYSIPTKTKVEINNWNALGEMSSGVSHMVKQLGEYATESPEIFVDNLKRDTKNNNITVGDAALILCEIKQAKLNKIKNYNEYKKKISSLTKEYILEIRKMEMRKYGLPEDDTITYLSIQRMMRLIK